MPVLVPNDVVVSFFVTGEPIPQGSKSIVNGRLIEKTNLRAKTLPAGRLDRWRKNVATRARFAMQRRRPVDAPVLLSCVFALPRPRSHFRRTDDGVVLKPDAPQFHTKTPDLVKLVRAVEDAMSKIVYRDDSLVVAYVDPTYKRFAKDGRVGGAAIKVRYACSS